MKTVKSFVLVLSLLLTSACGDFPDYRFNYSANYCELSFPFAGGIIGRQYVGYFRIISTLRFIDADPEVQIVVTGPSHIELETGSIQTLQIANKSYAPTFTSRYFQGELGHYGKAFTWTKEQSKSILDAIRAGDNIEMSGRLDVGKMYETTIYNLFFESKSESFERCVNRLLNEQDFETIKQLKLKQQQDAEAEDSQQESDEDQ